MGIRNLLLFFFSLSILIFAHIVFAGAAPFITDSKIYTDKENYTYTEDSQGITIYDNQGKSSYYNKNTGTFSTPESIYQYKDNTYYGIEKNYESHEHRFDAPEKSYEIYPNMDRSKQELIYILEGEGE